VFRAVHTSIERAERRERRGSGPHVERMDESHVGGRARVRVL
jgi:hypothetical protein